MRSCQLRVVQTFEERKYKPFGFATHIEQLLIVKNIVFGFLLKRLDDTNIQNNF